MMGCLTISRTVAEPLTACSGEVVNKLFGRHHNISTLPPGFLTELSSAEMIFFVCNSVRFQLTFANASQLPATERAVPLHPGRFSFSGPERVSFFQPVLVQRAAFLLHPSLLSVLSAAERFAADEHKRGFTAHLFSYPLVRPSVRPSVPAGVCLPVAAASRNAAVNFNRGAINGGLGLWTRHQTPCKPSEVWPQMTRLSVRKLLLCGPACAKQEAGFILQSSRHTRASCEVITAEEKPVATRNS